MPGLGLARAAAAASAAALVVLAGAAPASADDVTWSLAPVGGTPNFVYAVEPGQSVDDVLVVTNPTASPIDLAVYGTDAFTTAEGQLDLLPAAQEPTGLGTWLETSASTVHVEAGSRVEVPFTLRVPDDAAPGDHAGGIVTSLATTSGDGTLTVDRRLALRVHARVAGELTPALAVTGVDVVAHGTLAPRGTVTATVTYTLTNTGNTRLVPTESVRVSGPGGSGARVVTDTLDEVLPGSAVQRTVEVTGVRPLGRATADVRVDGVAVGIGGGGATTGSGSASTWAVPWAIVAIVVLVVAAAAGAPALRDRLRRRRRPDGDPSLGAGPEPEQS
ncbi:protein of unknown function DUF916 cell surface putative [Xylanimonas cellulosilytica DSM 15894]|uniref:DUF916 domain-containing protein n=1 Tax=Xylanimonas cellulosilytica (strain DSM 15894 / JCM 12276 / CECT 5975 / KCTC 9989 / LMG 20990 / NBRC 107835 / XIL07) TaxID=446471 RepID=D1BXY8_XYLCX|nr:protein of unknown function DUF916 cell surface putative [Xylanimonas cellulosilytica DSM 15894]